MSDNSREELSTIYCYRRHNMITSTLVAYSVNVH
jgi:hypothetical protein